MTPLNGYELLTSDSVRNVHRRDDNALALTGFDVFDDFHVMIISQDVGLDWPLAIFRGDVVQVRDVFDNTRTLDQGSARSLAAVLQKQRIGIGKRASLIIPISHVV